MINSSEQFNTAVLEGGHPYQIRISEYLGGLENTTVPIECDILSCRVHKGSAGDNSFGMGRVFVPYVEMEISAEPDLRFQEGYTDILLETGLELNGEVEWINVGIFVITKLDYERNYQNARIKMTAYGRIGAGFGKWVPNDIPPLLDAIFPQKRLYDRSNPLANGLTLQNMVSAVQATPAGHGDYTGFQILFNGVTIGNIVMDLDSPKVTERDSEQGVKTYIYNPFWGFTCRQLLEIIAIYTGSYCTEDSNGNVVFFKYPTSPTVEYTGDSMTTYPTIQGDKVDIEGINFVSIRKRFTGEGIEYEAYEIPIITGVPIWKIYRPDIQRYPTFQDSGFEPGSTRNKDRFVAAYASNIDVPFSFTPATLNLAIGDPRLEPWDVVRFTDFDDTEYIVPCMNIVHTFHGSVDTEIVAPAIDSDNNEGDSSGSGAGSSSGSGGGISQSDWQNIKNYTQAELSALAERLELRSPAVYFDTKANWDAQTTLVGEENSIYVYTDYQQKDGHNIAGIKVGDGNAYLVDNPFLDTIYYDHVRDSDIHITAAERAFWNNKDRCYYSLTDLETLVFTKN